MEQNKNFNKKKLIFLFQIFLIIVCFFSLFVLSGCTSKVIDYTYMVNKNYVPTDATVFTDNLEQTSIKLNTDRDFRILQLTDVHIGNGSLTLKRDKKAIEAVVKLIEHSTPDLIILSGDLVFSVSPLTGTNDNLTALKVLCKVIESYKTPWTMCFGNHDAESFTKFSKSEICEYLESDELKYCLFSRGPSEIDGMGNHIINIYNYDNSFNSSIFLFDNGMYNGDTQLSGYQEISDSQVEWYKNKILLFNDYFNTTINSYVYYHVPGKEYKLGWEEYKNQNPEVKYFFGEAGEKNEKISCPDELGSFFPTAVELKSTKAIFCGHDHFNNFSIEYEGIRLTYSKSIDYTAYALQGISNKTEQRGATLLSLKGVNTQQSDEFVITSIKLTDIE